MKSKAFPPASLYSIRKKNASFFNNSDIAFISNMQFPRPVWLFCWVFFVWVVWVVFFFFFFRFTRILQICFSTTVLCCLLELWICSLFFSLNTDELCYLSDLLRCVVHAGDVEMYVQTLAYCRELYTLLVLSPGFSFWCLIRELIFLSVQKSFSSAILCG